MLVGMVLFVFALLGSFLYLVYGGWFASLRRGFYVSLMLAVGGSAFVSAALFGIWAWDTTKNIMFQQVVSDLRDDGAAAEASLLVGTTLALGDLNGEAAEQAAGSSKHPLEVIASHLEVLLR